MRKALATAIFITASMYGIAIKPIPAFAKLVTPQVGMVYSTHTPPTGGCPELEFHVRVGPNRTLSGVIGRDGMQSIWRVSGTYTPQHTFHLDSQEVGGEQRTGQVDGQVRDNGSLVMTLSKISGPSPCENKTIYVPWFRDGNDWGRPAPGGGGG